MAQSSDALCSSDQELDALCSSCGKDHPFSLGCSRPHTTGNVGIRAVVLVALISGLFEWQDAYGTVAPCFVATDRPDN